MVKISETYGVIGDPIAHSYSPEIHRFLFNRMDLPFKYETIHVTSEGLADFIESSRKSERPGFNVTIPHKETILKYLDEIDPLAKQTGAVNTASNKKNRWIGHNTDIHGCSKALELSDWSSANGKTILLGAGGAARAAVMALYSLGVDNIAVYDVDPRKSNKLKFDFEAILSIHSLMDLSLERKLEAELVDASLLINATPVGMWPSIEDSPLPCSVCIPGNITVFDMVYRPVETRLLRSARSNGARTISGLHMLIAQAIAAQEIWLERKLPEELFDLVFEHIMNIMKKDESDTHPNSR